MQILDFSVFFPYLEEERSIKIYIPEEFLICECLESFKVSTPNVYFCSSRENGSYKAANREEEFQVVWKYTKRNGRSWTSLRVYRYDYPIYWEFSRSPSFLARPETYDGFAVTTQQKVPRHLATRGDLCLSQFPKGHSHLSREEMFKRINIVRLFCVAELLSRSKL